jgi:hypothetical protein
MKDNTTNSNLYNCRNEFSFSDFFSKSIRQLGRVKMFRTRSLILVCICIFNECVINSDNMTSNIRMVSE